MSDKMKFIKVTSRSSLNILYINRAHIVAVIQAYDSDSDSCIGDTIIVTVDYRYPVTESQEKVMELINDTNL